MPPRITLDLVTDSRLAQTKLDQTGFGGTFSDHMLVADFTDGNWRDIRIQAYGPLSLAPSISALQYGISVFEGHKAFRTIEDHVVLFRPRDNFDRLRKSCRRLALPEVPEGVYLDGLRELIRIDRGWVPGPLEGSLYVRPCIFAIDENIRVRPPANCRFVILTCPVGQYYAEPLKLFAAKDYVRAFAGGTGDVKPAGNYAPTLLVERQAQQLGYHSVLWLDGREHRFVEEAGVMNIFFVISGKVVTPDLGGTILPGITRDTVITLVKEMGVRVEERPISIDEIVESHAAGLIQECFGTGTAATIAHVIQIGYDGYDLNLPPVAQREIGPVLLQQLTDILFGRQPDRFGWLMEV